MMYAAVYASEQDMRVLIDAGADVNAANDYQATG